MIMESAEFDLKQLVDAKQPPEARREAARGFLSKIFPSGIASILETQGVDETKNLQRETLERLQSASSLLARAITADGNQDGEAKAEALQIKNLLDTVQEVIQEIGQETAQIPVGENGELPEGSEELDDGQEDGKDPHVRASAAVRGAFIYLPPLHGHCKEKCFPLEVECGGCGVVVKEHRGLQLRRVLRCITKVVEPWFSRRRLIRRWVWVLEWVPVEFIKTITVKCCCDKPHTHCDTKVVLDRPLIWFWRCW